MLQLLDFILYSAVARSSTTGDPDAEPAFTSAPTSSTSPRQSIHSSASVGLDGKSDRGFPPHKFVLAAQVTDERRDQTVRISSHQETLDAKDAQDSIQSPLAPRFLSTTRPPHTHRPCCQSDHGGNKELSRNPSFALASTEWWQHCNDSRSGRLSSFSSTCSFAAVVYILQAISIAPRPVPDLHRSPAAADRAVFLHSALPTASFHSVADYPAISISPYRGYSRLSIARLIRPSSSLISVCGFGPRIQSVALLPRYQQVHRCSSGSQRQACIQSSQQVDTSIEATMAKLSSHSTGSAADAPVPDFCCSTVILLVLPGRQHG